MIERKEKLLVLLDILRDIRDCNKNNRKSEGICNLFSIIVLKYYKTSTRPSFFELYSLYGTLKNLDINWADYPRYSGATYYPVKHPTISSPINAFNNCTNLWYGAYGQERYKLLDWLIAQVRIKLSEQP